MSYLGRPIWPPEWTGTHGPDNPLPRGEVGILVQVEHGSSVVKPPHCIVVIEWNEQEYLATLCFEEETFLGKIVGLLRSCLGRPIAEIGSLDIP